MAHEGARRRRGNRNDTVNHRALRRGSAACRPAGVPIRRARSKRTRDTDARMFDSGAGTTPATGNIVGHVRVLPNVRSPQLRNARDIQVYLPPSYKTSGRHYPVVYMHDGQNLFDPELSFAGEWGVDETMERLGPQGFEAIVVAIPEHGRRTVRTSTARLSTRARAVARATPTSISSSRRSSREIDRKFRTRREREHTGIVGSSMGGLISLYGFLRNPDVFGFCGAMSPSLWFANRAIFDYAASLQRWFGRIYLDIGSEEGQRHVRNTQSMSGCSGRSARTPATRSSALSRRAPSHRAGWAQRFEMAVRFLLPRQKDEVNW